MSKWRVAGRTGAPRELAYHQRRRPDALERRESWAASEPRVLRDKALQKGLRWEGRRCRNAVDFDCRGPERREEHVALRGSPKGGL